MNQPASDTFQLNLGQPLDNTPIESNEYIQAQQNCSTKFPPIRIASKDYYVCVKNGSQVATIPPKGKMSFRLAITNSFFQRLLDVKRSNESGVYLGLAFKDLSGDNVYYTQSGLLPYRVSNGKYLAKIF